MAKRNPPKYKFQIVLERLQGEQSVGQLVKNYNIHSNKTLRFWPVTARPMSPFLAFVFTIFP